jgi:hypothetical protein
MIRWGRGRSQGRGCCIIVPIGCLLSVMLILVFCGLAFANSSRGASKTFTNTVPSGKRWLRR